MYLTLRGQVFNQRLGLNSHSVMTSLTESQLKRDFIDINELYAKKKKNGFFIPVRYTVSALVLLATINLYLCRINLSEAIVVMSKVKVVKSEFRSASDVCVVSTVPEVNSTSKNVTMQEESKGEFDWDATTQGLILGAFFYGYILFQILGGRLAEVFGAKWLCGGGIFVSIVINTLTPLIARTNNFSLFFSSRVVLGMFQSFVFPSCYALFSKWSPDHERR